MEETKTDLPDMGALQRRMAFYVRGGRDAAQALGWRPVRVAGLVIGLDTRALADRLGANRDLVAEAFPTPVEAMVAWLRDPAARPPHGWAIGLTDPGSKAEPWLRPVPGGSRRRPSVYLDYRDAAMRMRRRR